MFVSTVLQCKLDIILPPHESTDFLKAFSEGSGELDTLWEALRHIDVRNAKASVPSDKDQILNQIASGPGYSVVNQRVREKLHSWFIETASQEVQRLKACCSTPCQRVFEEAYALQYMGDYREARVTYEKASCTYRRAGTDTSLDGANFQRQYADFLSTHGEMSEAMQLLSDVYRESVAPQKQAAVALRCLPLGDVGVPAREVGGMKRAKEICDEAYGVVHETGAVESLTMTRVMTMSGWLKAEIGDTEGALRDCQEAYRYAESSGLCGTEDGINSMFALA
eukprot:CAMPEP_0115362256 /NCGR_PEP_ID=MMETSP0270-20121206/102614_1 /TAXON_ID=71861 /ORGANISM="Scrippsiella trochoidea, Strain CCMP3099" /LENGTH=280 /DNA_ID=CAMNT_0002784827 /DNA_START=21 /DNA_END=861 /DNA_ORIENTATION=-